MKITKFFAICGICLPLLFLCSCASTGDKFTPPSTDQLELGKLTSADALMRFGKPRITGTRVTADGSFEIYKYVYAAADISAISQRVLLLEFKEGKLNAYYYWSSFEADKTKVDLKNMDKLKAGVGKLTKDDVVALAGKPNAKGYCPSTLSDFKDRCAKNTEIWGWLMTDNYSLWALQPQKLKTVEMYVTFDSDGKIAGIDLANINDQNGNN